MSYGNKNALVISPEFPNPTPSGFAKNRYSPFAQISNLFDADVSNVNRPNPPDTNSTINKPTPRPTNIFQYFLP